MLRRVTAFLAMLAVVALLGVLIWQVYEHHRRGTMLEPTTFVKITVKSALAT